MIAFIVSSLEEREREETFRLKWLKTKMENKEEEAQRNIVTTLVVS